MLKIWPGYILRQCSEDSKHSALESENINAFNFLPTYEDPKLSLYLQESP